MARYKPYSYAQGKFIPIHFAKQILPGTFEYSLNHLIDHELDLSRFDERFKNDVTGASAYDPRILLKIVLYAYSRGIFSMFKGINCLGSSFPCCGVFYSYHVFSERFTTG